MSAAEKHIGDSSPEINTANPKNWKSIGQLAEEIARRIAAQGGSK
jgi:hypothetical protein